MLDKNNHKIILLKILKEIYSDVDLRVSLGFKGGTALFIFYDLPRLSVDLDFNLLSPEKKLIVFEKLTGILNSYGKLLEKIEKKHTLFFLLSFEKGKRKIKLEISKRPTTMDYETKNHLGIPIFVATRESLASGKLSALLTRKKFASRDIFDLWFILKNNWDFDINHLKKQTGLDLKTALKKAKDKITKIKTNRLLQGLGELIEEKQKGWIKNKLKDDLIFYINLYLENKV